MLSTEIIVREFAEEVIAGIRALMPSATGKTADSLFWRFDGTRLQIGSTFSWITVLEDGRPPGKMPPRESIKSWIEAVGLVSDLPADSLAYLIARSIGQKGTLLWQQGGHSGVLSTYVNAEYIRENLTDKLVDHMVRQVKLALLNK